MIQGLAHEDDRTWILSILLLLSYSLNHQADSHRDCWNKKLDSVYELLIRLTIVGNNLKLIMNLLTHQSTYTKNTCITFTRRMEYLVRGLEKTFGGLDRFCVAYQAMLISSNGQGFPSGWPAIVRCWSRPIQSLFNCLQLKDIPLQTYILYFEVPLRTLVFT